MKRTIKVDALARLEGEGSFRVTVSEGRVAEVEFGVYEPPRFFEGILRGRGLEEAPDITARICGICPVAHQLTSCRAMEAALGLEVDPAIADLRRLIYCGEWIESHALHVFMLHAPDFLGYPDALAMADGHPQLVQTGLRLKKLGNRLVTLLGGREIHPVNLKVGGFYSLPPAEALAGLAEELAWAERAAADALRRLAALDFPDYQRDYLLVSLRQPGSYPVDRGGRIASSDGLDIPVEAYPEHFSEEQVPHSTALHASLDGRTYLVGPLARYALNRAELTLAAREAADAAGLGEACLNPFRSILVRAVELVDVCGESLELVRSWRPPRRASVPVPSRAGAGLACSEAPRGLLVHQYELDRDGSILRANIVTPTSQNQRAIEQDLKQVVTTNQGTDPARLRRLCETTIRNYDPCISCSTH